MKCKVMREAEGRRKLIWGRRETQAKGKGEKWKERVGRRMEKAKQMTGLVGGTVEKAVMRKVRRWAKNVELEGK